MELTSRASVRWAWVKVILMLALPVLFLLGVLVVAPAMSVYDSSHQVPLECTIRSAHLSEGSKRYVPFRVIIDTEDCGRVSIARGVTDVNHKEIADSFGAGDRYEFQVGKFEREWWGPLGQKFGGSIVAESYRKIDLSSGK